jgi:hypothetical protein
MRPFSWKSVMALELEHIHRKGQQRLLCHSKKVRMLNPQNLTVTIQTISLRITLK